MLPPGISALTGVPARRVMGAAINSVHRINASMPKSVTSGAANDGLSRFCSVGSGGDGGASTYFSIATDSLLPFSLVYHTSLCITNDGIDSSQTIAILSH